MKNLESILEMYWSGVFGEAIVHSLWQGAIIFIVYWLVSRRIQESKHQVNVGLAALFLQFTVSIATVVYLHLDKLGHATSTGVLTALRGNISITEKYAPWIFCGWIAGFLFLLIKYGASVLYLQWLKKTGIIAVSEKLNRAINNLKSKIDFSLDKIKISESTKVETAVVLGYLKPIVLVPIGLVTQLSVSQLEVILAHEIAHIKRQDFIINMFYTFVEVLFFYHPVYWFIGKEVRENREHACDELAAEWTGEGILLAKTLAQIQDISYTRSLAMAFGKPTLTRIQRLLGQKTESYQSRIVGLAIMLTVLCSLAFTPAKKEKAIITNENKIQKQLIFKSDTAIVTEMESRFTTSGNDDKIKIKTKNHDVKITSEGIVLNGQKMVFTPEQQKEFDKRWRAMQDNQSEIEEVSKSIGIESGKIGEIYAKSASKMQIDPMEDPNFKIYIKEINENSEVISKEAKIMSEKITKINVNDKEYHKKVEKITKDFDQKTKQYEKVIKELEPKMEVYEKRMEEQQIEIEKMFEGPIKDVEARLEIKEKEMDVAAERFEKSHEALLEFLPKDVKKEVLQGSKHYRQAPPAPPAPQSPPNGAVPAPPKPPSKLKAPAAPPAIPDGPKKKN